MLWRTHGIKGSGDVIGDTRSPAAARVERGHHAQLGACLIIHVLDVNAHWQQHGRSHPLYQLRLYLAARHHTSPPRQSKLLTGGEYLLGHFAL